MGCPYGLQFGSEKKQAMVGLLLRCPKSVVCNIQGKAYLSVSAVNLFRDQKQALPATHWGFHELKTQAALFCVCTSLLHAA